MAANKKAISFGLVHIPIELNNVVQNNDTNFNQLHEKCGSRINYKKMCSHCKKEVKPEEIIRGYQYTPDKYVTFTNEDMKKLQLSSSTPIEIVSFVKIDEIDPMYYEKSYYLTSKDNSKAFNLFKVALKNTNKVALAKTVIGTKFYYVTLRFEKNNIIMNTLYFDEEISVDEDAELSKFSKAEVDMATQLIDAMTAKFEPDKYKDEYQERIKDAIEQKVKGKEIVAAKKPKEESVSDLMEALKLSLKKVK